MMSDMIAVSRSWSWKRRSIQSIWRLSSLNWVSCSRAR